MSKASKFALLAAVAFGMLTIEAAPIMWAYEKPANAGSRDQALHCKSAKAIIDAGGKLELGQWYTYWDYCKKYCDANGIPLFAIYSNQGCVHCWYADKCFNEPAFKDFQQNEDAGKAIYCFLASGEAGCPDQSGSAGHAYLRNNKQFHDFPYVLMEWKKGGVEFRYEGDSIRANGRIPTNFNTDAGTPACTSNIIAKIRNAFKDWHPAPEVTYVGGYFTQTNYPHASLQAEATTTYVDVEIVRDSTLKTNQTMKISAPDKTPAEMTIDWAENQLKQDVSIASFNSKWFVEGKDVTLQLWGADDDGKDEVKSELTIACVKAENTAVNPDFTGCSAFGRWTMDLEKAKAKTKGTAGKAYTLVCVQGSQWCPDCGNVEKNFLGVKDGSGKYKFAEWAKSKNIALVTVDIPNYNSASADAASPCLLKREAYLTNPEGAASATMHSGLGYLTRKMISDVQAQKVLQSNRDLVSKMTYEGGFNRPEERDYKNRVYRTGAPIFVLLDKEGNVRAELVRLAEDSPTDAGDFDNYIKRFEEMLDICDNNATEIENNYASAGSVKFKANGGSEAARLCNADMYDTFLLEGVGGNARQMVVVKGDSKQGFDDDAEVTVEFQKLAADGKAVTLGNAVTGKLRNGVTNEHTFTEAGDYYVQVRGWGADRGQGYNANAYKLTSSKDRHFQNYVITGATILEPQEDEARANPPEGSDKVSISLRQTDESGKPIIYRIKGLDDVACAGVLKPIPGAPVGFYSALADGIAEVTLDRVNGEISYQIWNSGTIGFVETAREVLESVCDLDGEPLNISFRRTGGKSGAVLATVAVDRVSSTFDPARSWLCKDADREQPVEFIELAWADGDTADKVVSVYIDDDLFYDGNGTVVLKAVTNGGEAGDVAIAEGKDTFTLTVVEDEKQDPGKAFFSKVDPEFARKGVVYVREDEGARICATRVENSDGLVAGVLNSSVKGTVFSTENDRDLEKLEDVSPELVERFPKFRGAQVLYWSSREAGDKWVKVTGIPAGKTAKVTFTPINMKTIAASNTVTVVSVAADAPGFAASANDWEFVRYVTAAKSAELDKDKLSATADEKTVSFHKFSGVLPAGLKVGYDAGRKAMSVTGATTAKAGVYEAVYQAREKRDGKTVNGLLTKVRITVVDPVAKGAPGEPPLNPACAASRTLKNIPVYDEENKRLAGVVQLTIPPTGKASARYTGIDGNISFSAKNWSGVSGDDWSLQADLAANREGWTMEVVADPEGAVDLTVNGADGESYSSHTDGKVWKKTPKSVAEASAAAWEGYYTVVMKPFNWTGDAPPTGYGYMTLKMNSPSAVAAGTFTVTGMLPDGTKLSGSFALVSVDGEVFLPILKKSTRDTVSAVVGLQPNAKEEEERRCIESPDNCNGYWAHTEKTCSYAVDFTLHGSYYDRDEDLPCCCEEYYQTSSFDFFVNNVKVNDTKVEVEPGKITVGGTNPSGLRLSFNRTTGVISGTFNTAEGNRVSYSGVVVNGWGENCGCGNYDVYLPFMSGSCYWSEGNPRRTFGSSVKIGVDNK